MNGQNKKFMGDITNYLNSHAIIVPTCFSNIQSKRFLVNGHTYEFDLQTITPQGVTAMSAAARNIVILTVMENRGKNRSQWTRGINAMWLAGPDTGGITSYDLPSTMNYIFTESLGGCSVYIDDLRGKIYHDYSGKLPIHNPPIPDNQHAISPYGGDTETFNQTCAVAYKKAGVWNVACSVSYNNMGVHKIHNRSNYTYLGGEIEF